MRLLDKWFSLLKIDRLPGSGGRILKGFLDSEPHPKQNEWIEIHNSEIESVWVLKKDICLISTDPMGIEVCVVVGSAPLPYRTRSIDSAESIMERLYGSG